MLYCVVPDARDLRDPKAFEEGQGQAAHLRPPLSDLSCSRAKSVTNRAITGRHGSHRVGLFWIRTDISSARLQPSVTRSRHASDRSRNPWRHRRGRSAVHRPAREPSLVQGHVARREPAIRGQGVSRRDRVAAGDAAADRRGRAPIVDAATPGRAPRLVFSGLDSSVAGDIEAAFAQAGHFIVSNSRNYRMETDVPLLIPEVNADHLALLEEAGGGARLEGARSSPTRTARPSCWRWRWRRSASSACDGDDHHAAGDLGRRLSRRARRGTSSANVIPYIGGGEEEKIETETSKILGASPTAASRTTRSPSARRRRGCRCITATPNRSRCRSSGRQTAGALIEAWSSFRGRPQDLELPSAPPPADRLPARGQPAAAGARRRTATAG